MHNRSCSLYKDWIIGSAETLMISGRIIATSFYFVIGADLAKASSRHIYQLAMVRVTSKVI
jgi:hypothetical protein